MGCADVGPSTGAPGGNGTLQNILHFDGWAQTFADESQPMVFDDFEVSEQFARDGCVSPTDLADSYRNAAQAINPGIEVVFDSDVCAVATPDGSGAVELRTTAGDVFVAQTVINAAGAWVNSVGAADHATQGQNSSMDSSAVPIGLMRADYWMMQAPRPIPADTPLLTLAGAYIKPAGNVPGSSTPASKCLSIQRIL